MLMLLKSLETIYLFICCFFSINNGSSCSSEIANTILISLMPAVKKNKMHENIKEACLLLRYISLPFNFPF